MTGMTELVYLYFVSVAFLIVVAYFVSNQDQKFTLYDAIFGPSYPEQYHTGPDYLIAYTKWIPFINTVVALLFVCIFIGSIIAEITHYRSETSTINYIKRLIKKYNRH